ncbi:MAG: sigma-70 family RNA polymerase sigma factor [Planctomycetota bacterium]
MDDLSTRLVRRYQEGDEAAAQEIFDRYVARLLRLAGSRISPGLGRRVEAEDVVQSVYRSFFHRIGEDRLQVSEAGQLWGLLAAITVNKVRAKARFHGADKRNVTMEASAQSSASCFGLVPTEIAREPTAEEAAALAEQYRLAVERLSPVGQKVFQLHLENEPVEEIATKIKRSERTVRRELEKIRSWLSEELRDPDGDA